MYEKMMYFWTQKDSIRKMLLQEPRGRSSMCTNLVVAPCDPRADAGFLIMEADEFAPMSGSNTICTATVLLETGMIPMQEPITQFTFDTAAGLVQITAECEAGKCKSVSLDNVPSFVFALDKPIDVPGLGTISVDIAWGGMMFALVDASSCGLKIANSDASKLIEVGERIKRAVQTQFVPVHP
jgi:proline racemase